MRFLEIKRRDGRTSFINLERVIYVSLQQGGKEYVFYFDGPDRSVGAHEDEYDRITQLLAQLRV